MNSKLYLLSKALFLSLPLVGAGGGFVACEDDLSSDSHYKTPSFLAGNAIEVLQKEGRYKTFLKGISLIGFTDVVDSQMLTVLAPDDEAFAKFLRARGYESIEEMYLADPVLTEQVITYHLIYYAMDWNKMTNFRPLEGDGATEADLSYEAGMYNRFRTRCAVPDTREYNGDPQVKDTVTVYHNERYLTVFSEKLFATLGIDAETNYKYFFPNSQWNPNHLANGFNVMNAAVLDTAAVVTDNGFLYHIDQVIEPVGTLYQEMGNKGNYTAFQRLFDKYAVYEKSSTMTDIRGKEVYTKTYEGLPAIDSEWYFNSYLNFYSNCFRSYNMMAPSDQALSRLFQSYWEPGCGYKDITDLNQLIQRILVKECVIYPSLLNQGGTSIYACYPEFITKGSAYSAGETQVSNDPAEFDDIVFCNNGILYGSSKMDLPGIFSSVAGPVFKDVRYLPQLYVLNQANALYSLAGKEVEYVVLVPDTAQFARTEPAIRLFADRTQSPVIYELQQWNDEAGDYTAISSSVCANIGLMHASTNATELKTTGTQVIETDASFNYWYVQNGKITTNALFNQQLNPTFHSEIWYGFHEITNAGGKWSNGRAYAYDYPGVFQSAANESLERELAINNNAQYPYYCFSQLLRAAGLANNGLFSGMLTLDPENPRFIAFVPTNQALKTAIEEHLMPGADTLHISEDYEIYMNNKKGDKVAVKLTEANKLALANYLLSYFVPAERTNFTAYPYVGSTCKGALETPGIYGLELMDDGSAISLRATGDKAEGTVVPIEGKYGYLPFAFSDGAFHLLNGILK